MNYRDELKQTEQLLGNRVAQWGSNTPLHVTIDLAAVRKEIASYDADPYGYTLKRYDAALAEYREAVIDAQNKYHTTESYDDFKDRCSEQEREEIEAFRKACEDAYQDHYATL